MIAQHIPSAVSERPAAPPDSRVLRSLDALAAIESRFLGMAEQLREHIPDLRVQRAFYDGAWVIGLRVGGREEFTADGDAPSGRAFSRLDVQISLDAERSSVELTSRSTVRNRDRRRETHAALLDAEGHASIDEFLETAIFAFVDRYFDRG